jgi:hypothetical protein
MPRRKKTEPLLQLGIINDHAGKEISINLKKRIYFGLGDNPNKKKLWLSPENWYTTLPDDLTPKEASMISQAIRSGDLIWGKTWIPPIDKDKKVMQRYLTLVKNARGLDQEFKDQMVALHRHKKDGNYTALEIFRKMLDQEVATKNRGNFISYLKEGISNYDGPVFLVEDFPDDPGNFEVAIDTNTMQAVHNDPEKRYTSLEFQGLDDPNARSEALNNALE